MTNILTSILHSVLKKKHNCVSLLVYDAFSPDLASSELVCCIPKAVIVTYMDPCPVIYFTEQTFLGNFFVLEAKADQIWIFSSPCEGLWIVLQYFGFILLLYVCYTCRIFPLGS